MNTPRVSVILPFYNAGDSLSEAITSICNQSFQDWELLLINNNSNDVSLSIAKSWQEKDNRIRLLNENRQGIAFALNKGLQLARGEYIARMDADDWSLPNRLELQYYFLKKRKEVGVVASQCSFHSDLISSTGYRLFVDWQNEIITPTEHFKNRFIESPVAHPSVMFRKSIGETFGNYSNGNIPEDYELWLRWMSHGVKFEKIPQKLLVWKDHPDRLSRIHNNYQEQAFDQVKCHYLAQWLKFTLDKSKKIVVCGTGKKSRFRAALLQTEQVPVHAFTDVVNKEIKEKAFLPASEISKNADYFYINFISKRGVGKAIRQFFLNKGLEEEVDFIMAS